MIRKLTPDDCATYEETLTQYIYESIKNIAYMESYQWSAAREKCAELRAYLAAEKGISYGAFDGEYLAGFVWAYVFPYRDDKKRVHVSILHVSAPYRNHSLGKELLLRIEEDARHMGCPTVFLYAEGANTGAQRFYARMGYVLERVQLAKHGTEIPINSNEEGGKFSS